LKLQQVEVLSEKEMHLIHEASVDILENTGVLVYSGKMRTLFAQEGLRVDEEKRRVYIPRSVLEKALESSPASFPLYNLKGEKKFTVGEREPLYACGHNAVFFLDTETRVRRESTVKDVERFVKIADNLTDIDVVGIPVMPQDTPAASTLLHAVSAAFRCSSKPVYFSSESAGINRAIMDMAETIEPNLQEKPFLVSQLSPTSPLYWEEGAVESLWEVCRRCIPLAILPEPMAGASAPYTVAGLLTMHNTECLSGVVFSQVIQPGTPVMYASSWTGYSMRHNVAVIGTAETDILRMAGAQMARYYHLPSHTTAPNADSHFHDEQNAWERTLSTFCSALGGNHLIVNAGMFATGLTVSLEQLVMDAEIIGMIRRIQSGIQITEETIALRDIQKTGPQGSYLMAESTLAHLRNGEFYEPLLSVYDNYERCRAGGREDVVIAAREKVLAALASPVTWHISTQAEKNLERIIKDFEKEEAGS